MYLKIKNEAGLIFFWIEVVTILASMSWFSYNN